MQSILSIPTIMICTSITSLVVALALTYVWFNDSRERATAWWCCAMWTATVATGILATRAVLPAWFSIGIGHIFAALAFSLAWAGFAVFSGRRPSYFLIALGPLLWVACYFGVEEIRQNINYRGVLISSVHGFYSALIVRNAVVGWRQERLPSFLATIGFYLLNTLLYTARIPIMLLYPAVESNGQIHSPWIAAVAVEGFTVTIFSTFVFMALIKERAERRYRLAAEIDALTAVSSRRHFVSETRAALERKPKSGVLAVIDLDFFKKVNDTYGHMAGDRLLQSFAAHVTTQLDPGMAFGRLGGEEFGLFAPDMSDDEAAAFLENVRSGVEALEIPFNGHALKVTTSIGAASVADAGLDFDHLMAGADNALYLCKNEGRNQVRFFSPALRLHKIAEAGLESRVSLSKTRVSRISVRGRQRQA